MPLRVLILGANGFIGSSLTQAILEQKDWEVYGMDVGDHKLGDSLGQRRMIFEGLRLAQLPQPPRKRVVAARCGHPRRFHAQHRPEPLASRKNAVPHRPVNRDRRLIRAGQ